VAFSKKFIEQIKYAGVLKLTEKYTILKKISNDTWMGRCPNPEHNDKTPSFMVKQNKNGPESWACFGCHAGKKDYYNYGSDNIAFIQWINAILYKKILSFPQAVMEVARFYNINIEQDKYDYLYDNNYKKNKAYIKNLNTDVIEYLKIRGLNEVDIKKWQIGFDGERITFPIFNAYNQIAGFSRRILQKKEGEPKYKNSFESPIFKKQEIFYGLNFVNNIDSRLLITEGQIDVILAHKYNINFAVATMGCNLSDYQISYIKEHNKIPILCYDGDIAGKHGIHKALERLYLAGIQSRVLILPENKDLADIANKLKENLSQYIETHTMPYFQYYLQDIINGLDVMISNKIIETMPRIKQIINNIKDPDEKVIAKNFVQQRIKLWAA
jgi:DNA primase